MKQKGIFLCEAK